MGGHGRGRKKNTEILGSGWEAKGPALQAARGPWSCTVHPADGRTDSQQHSATEQSNCSCEGKKFPLQTRHSFQGVSIPADGHESPTPQALAETAPGAAGATPRSVLPSFLSLFIPSLGN